MQPVGLEFKMSFDPDKSCLELATELSNNYWNSTPFDPHQTDGSGGGGIKSYLLSHGELLTMCFPSACSVNPLLHNHVAASWISGAIGPQVIPTISDVGLILNPSVADVNCIFPTDGATDARDGEGCGPLNFDPAFGSKGAASLNPVTRWYTRRIINSYKEFNYGDTDWEDIDCDEAFGMGHFFSYPLDKMFFPTYLPQQIFWKWVGNESTADLLVSSKDKTIIYERQETIVKRSYDAIMGHPVCSVFDPEPKFENGFFIYSGKDGLSPTNWQHAIEVQQGILATFPESTIWNEVVIGLPSQMDDLVLGVFYLDSPDMSLGRKLEIRKQAERNARLLGQKPLLKLDMTRARTEGEDVFACDEKELFTFWNIGTN